MDYDKVQAISNEMCALLEQQSNLMKTSPETLGSMSSERMDEYHKRNHRLQELCQQLTELT